MTQGNTSDCKPLRAKSRRNRSKKKNKSMVDSQVGIVAIYKAAINNRESIEKQLGVSPISFSIPTIYEKTDQKILIVSVREEEDLKKIPENIKIQLAKDRSVVVYLIARDDFDRIEQTRSLFK